ncbi:MAG: LPS-assembly protein LptD [Thermodesulfobacteriota bacterium]
MAASRKKHYNRILNAALAIAALLIASPAVARPLPWEITADSMVHLKEPEGVLAEGNVILMRPKEQDPRAMVIRADWVRYDLERGTVRARGNVYVLSNRDQINAETADLDLAAKTGTFGNATLFMAETNMYIRGEEVVKTGDFTYTLTNGHATACKTEAGQAAPWSFETSSADVTVDGMAHLTNVRMQVKDVPVLYTPYLVFPAKTKRESGLLLPEWSHSSRDGFGFVAPVFLNISPSMDATLYPGYLAERGFPLGAQFRYMQGRNSYGTFMASFLRDDLNELADLGDEYKRDGLLRRTDNRYWVRGKANHDFGDNLVGRLDLDLVSDQDYLQEFRDGSMGYRASNNLFLHDFGRDLGEETLPERESALQLVKSWSNTVVGGELRTRQYMANDLLLTGSDGDNILEPGEYAILPHATSSLQALPRIEFLGRTPLPGTPLTAHWDSEYVNYWRSEGLGAQRLDLHPRLTTALPRAGLIEGRATGGIRETAYQVEEHGGTVWNEDRFQERLGYDFTANLATTLMRDFDFRLGDASWLDHTIRPNLIYEYVTRSDDFDVRRLALDAEDTYDMKHWVTWQLNNYFGLGGTGWSREAASFKVQQSYDLRDAAADNAGLPEADRNWSDLRFDLEVRPQDRWRIRYQTNLSMYGQHVSRYALLNQYTMPGGGPTLSLDYRYLRHDTMRQPYFFTEAGESLHDLEGRIDTPITDTLFVTAYLNKSFSTDHTVESAVGLAYKPHCWMVQIEAGQAADERRLLLIFSLDGIGQALRLGRDL